VAHVQSEGHRQRDTARGVEQGSERCGGEQHLLLLRSSAPARRGKKAHARAGSAAIISFALTLSHPRNTHTYTHLKTSDSPLSIQHLAKGHQLRGQFVGPFLSRDPQTLKKNL